MTDAAVEAIESVLRLEAESIRVAERDVTRMKKHRAVTWRKAHRLGMKHREIAKLSKVKTSTVSGVLAPGAK